ncbi:protein FAR-RED IMPAIRED RESPONSE 1-like [Arachis stenosperma]|uniref:protein FAR-RED IMPAIRED RESPONSE 1-like n=1 Tax=Arachis stenosperma TaxID=217475 RepID=UPI0025AB9B5C|nr:protein FAR-RED IMPAIRED RESPONSE 1-like [Arachis stenosperma]
MTEGVEEFVINQAIGDEEVDPEEGMCFGTLEDARAYYYRYAARTEFVVKIRTTGWETINDQRVVVNQALHCNRDGYRTSRVKALQRRKTVASTNCKARCYLALDKMTGQWRISRVEVSHSHPLNPKLSGMFSANRQLNVDENHSIRNVFWADARCRAAWEYFGDVVTFDTTYKTNRYDMPFGSFVGVNHHGISTLLGCALLRNEDTRTFEWLFRTWLKCMGKAPICVITDQSLQMRSAETTLPHTRHRWCIWHILNKIPNKLVGYRHFDQLITCMKRIVFESKSKDSFERDWHDFIEEYDLHNSRWLNGSIIFWFLAASVWLLYRCYFIVIMDVALRVFFKDEFWAGMRSTQRSESMHSVFDKYLNSKSSLLQFVRQYQNCVIDKEQKELECDAADLRGIIPCVSSSPIEKQFQREYTNSMFRDCTADTKSCIARNHQTFNVIALCSNRMDFVATPEVAAILRDAMDSAREKLREHKEFEHQAAHRPNGNAQPSPTNVATSYKDTQPACSEMTDNLAMHSGSFISLLNSFHNAEQLCMCT